MTPFGSAAGWRGDFWGMRAPAAPAAPAWLVEEVDSAGFREVSLVSFTGGAGSACR